LCNDCGQRDHCQTPCKAVQEAMKQDNPGVMEKHTTRRIMVFPKSREKHFTELSGPEADQMNDCDVFPWASAEHRLRKTVVFVERFFHKTSYRDLAERYHVRENTIVTIYRQAIEQLAKMIEQLDSRREGIKAVQTKNFTDDQKAFLLVEVFGFNRVEVARMFKRDHKALCSRLKRMTDQYKRAF
jgi:hypothetical protein